MSPERPTKETGAPDTPVLFLVFNRPDVTRRVFESIRKARPTRLYVAADGARRERPDERQLTEQVRAIVSNVDWPCQPKFLLRDENLGCKRAVAEGIDWFFENEEAGIILEDDCLPHPDFFGFASELLKRYANEASVWLITGNNFQGGRKRGDASYYFSRYIHVWGWATWRRAWFKRDMDMQFWAAWKGSESWRSIFPDRVERRYWEKILDKTHADQIDTWDYPWMACVWLHGGLTATPNVNLVTNIGFGPQATHTRNASSKRAMMATDEIRIGDVRPDLKIDLEADRHIFNNVLGGRYMRFPVNVVVSLFRSIKKRIGAPLENS